MAQLAWTRSDTGRPCRVISTVLPAGPDNEPGNPHRAEALTFQRLAAQLAIIAHDPPTAGAWLEAHDRCLGWSSAVLGRAEGSLFWAQYHHASGDASLARQYAEDALAHASEPRQPLALIAVHRLLYKLGTEVANLDAAEEHLRQSLELAGACVAPFERALTLIEQARLRAAQGQPEDARVPLAEARALCEPLGAAPTLGRIAALEASLG